VNAVKLSTKRFQRSKALWRCDLLMAFEYETFRRSLTRRGSSDKLFARGRMNFFSQPEGNPLFLMFGSLLLFPLRSEYVGVQDFGLRHDPSGAAILAAAITVIQTKRDLHVRRLPAPMGNLLPNLPWDPPTRGIASGFQTYGAAESFSR